MRLLGCLNVLGEVLMKRLLLALLIIVSIPGLARSGYKEDFEKEFLTKPWAGPQLEESACIECHVSDKMDAKLRNIPQNWKVSIHNQYNISCHDCHGGDPTDPTISMSHSRGFVGAPSYAEVPEFCGKCHIGILKSYLESGHGKALKSSGKGPNCVTCHGSHKESRYIRKAGIDIINEGLCSQCHSYERAKSMKQALFLVEKKIGEIDKQLTILEDEGIFTEGERKTLFSTEAQFRTLFHTVDISLVKEKTDEFLDKLSLLEKGIQHTINELRFRKNFSAFIMLLFAAMGIVLFVLSKTPKE
jgi:nitrate/TMAO reductase-like tetraheme cytochrome c subunit